MTSIRTLSTEEVQARVARYSSLQPMSIAKDLEWVPQEAMDVVYARTILPMILEDQKNPFGKTAPVFGAGGLTMYISVIPPGQGPCLHSHNNTYETFMVLEGEIEYVGGRLKRFDKFPLRGPVPEVDEFMHAPCREDASVRTVGAAAVIQGIACRRRLLILKKDSDIPGFHCDFEASARAADAQPVP